MLYAISLSLSRSHVYKYKHIYTLYLQENGNVIRETDKREEVYFEKGQTKQLVEQWKTKKASPERDTPDAQVVRDAEILQQGKRARDTVDKENKTLSSPDGEFQATPRISSKCGERWTKRTPLRPNGADHERLHHLVTANDVCRQLKK